MIPIPLRAHPAMLDDVVDGKADMMNVVQLCGCAKLGRLTHLSLPTHVLPFMVSPFRESYVQA